MVLLEKDLATVGLKGELRPFELHGLRFFQQTTWVNPPGNGQVNIGNQGTYENTYETRNILS